MKKAHNDKIIFILIILLIFFIFIFKSKRYKIENFESFINVAYSFDKNYHFIVHVSMKSIMLSQNKSTFINFYILVSNLTTDQKTVINRIEEEHANCKIKYYDMGNQFKEFKLPNKIWTTANFYRLKLPDILKDVKKILYLDTDTLIYKDLTKLFNHNIKGKYFIGMLENKNKKFFIKHNISFNNFINTGVMLCNLEELRKDNISYKIIEYIKKNNNKTKFPVNEPTNLITYKKNGYFPPEYVVIGFCNKKEVFNYYKNSMVKINQTFILKTLEDPYIVHFILNIKPWRAIPNKYGFVCIDIISRFYEAARKTSYYNEILEEFPIYFNNSFIQNKG